MSDPVQSVIEDIIANIDTLPARELWRGVDALQNHCDCLAELIDDLPQYDQRVIIRIDNKPQLLRLQSAAHLAEYLTREGIYDDRKTD
jgi:hypothetical protein